MKQQVTTDTYSNYNYRRKKLNLLWHSM